jgi:hypothetical protein
MDPLETFGQDDPLAHERLGKPGFYYTWLLPTDIQAVSACEFLTPHYRMHVSDASHPRLNLVASFIFLHSSDWSPALRSFATTGLGAFYGCCCTTSNTDIPAMSRHIGLFCHTPTLQESYQYARRSLKQRLRLRRGKWNSRLVPTSGLLYPSLP